MQSQLRASSFLPSMIPATMASVVHGLATRALAGVAPQQAAGSLAAYPLLAAAVRRAERDGTLAFERRRLQGGSAAPRGF